MKSVINHFSNPHAVAHYAEGPPLLVPGFADMQRMARALLAESAPHDARVLVLGAGGGLELKVFADAEPGWSFDDVDPSAPMLALALDTIGAHAPRVTLHEGYVDAAPDGPFDAAACLLTMHFMPFEERARTVRAIHRRLRPGAPFVVAHMSAGEDDRERARWLARQLPILSPRQDEALLRDGGFHDVELFYVAGVFRGWIGFA